MNLVCLGTLVVEDIMQKGDGFGICFYLCIEEENNAIICFTGCY